MPQTGPAGGAKAFNSFPVAAELLLDLTNSILTVDFQFFPSCCGEGRRLRLPLNLKVFQFFPSCCSMNRTGDVGLTLPEFNFQFFPSCCRRLAAWCNSGAWKQLSILSQLLRDPYWRDPWGALYRLSILSQLLLVRLNLNGGPRQRNFQFFPSCCFTLFLFIFSIKKIIFQFFPSCCRRRLPREQAGAVAFNSFPVAAVPGRGWGDWVTLWSLSILSQLLQDGYCEAIGSKAWFLSILSQLLRTPRSPAAARPWS
jgi:hypothetical protein